VKKTGMEILKNKTGRMADTFAGVLAVVPVF
jgi:hypothetical protein